MTKNLLQLPVGSQASVVEVMDQPLNVRMEAMGIRRGAQLTLLAKTAGGSRLIRVGDARLSLARELCRAILVEFDGSAHVL